METRMNKVGIALFMLVSAFALGGCQTDAAPSATNTSTTSSSTSTTTTPTTTTPATTPTTPVVPATTYTMTLVPALTTLSAGGTTAVTATILANGVVDTTQVVDVTFTSSCTGQGKSTMDSPVVSSAGKAVSTYTDVKCASTDTLGASATIGGVTVSKSATITVQAASMGSIQFIGANPASIGIKGVGLTETSLVQFQVKDVLGQAAPAGLGVTFTLDTTTGGITFSPATTVTDANGMVSTTITSGTMPATVRVTATLTSNIAIKSQSDGLVISTGISDQDSFSLASDILNLEAWGYDGEVANLTISASDHFNNPVPDGAAVIFRSESGQVPSSCLIMNGQCTVAWKSVNSNAPMDGRVTILATMTGEESFTDLNGNNLYDAGIDTHPLAEDLPEAWFDINENGVRDANEEFRDFNVDGSYTGADGAYNGVLCASGCGTSKSVDVRRSIVLVMSSSGLSISIPSINVSGLTNKSVTATATICDMNGNVPPKGTTFTATTTNGTVILLNGNTMLNSAGPGCYLQSFKWTGDVTASTGDLTIEAKTPKGVVSSNNATVID